MGTCITWQPLLIFIPPTTDDVVVAADVVGSNVFTSSLVSHVAKFAYSFAVTCNILYELVVSSSNHDARRYNCFLIIQFGSYLDAACINTLARVNACIPKCINLPRGENGWSSPPATADAPPSPTLAVS